jgi:hypothetical protein
MFQTQIYLKKRYIHRLHVLNPLTNSDIIGSVDYFLVKPPQVKDAVTIDIDPVISVNSQNDAANVEQTRSNVRVSLVYTQASKALESANLASVPKEEKITTNRVVLENQVSQKQIPSLLRLNTTHKGTVKVRKLSLVEQPIHSMTTEKISKRVTSLKITTNLPTGALSLHRDGCMSAVVGQITRFAVPVPEDQLQTIIPELSRGNRRTLTYRNAVSTTGVPISFIDWTRMVQSEKMNENSDIKLVNKLSTMKEEEEEEKQIQTSSATENVDKCDSKVLVYDAVYFGNDNDFLEKSKARKVFRDNAIAPEDAKLFEMKEYTGKEDDADFEILENDSFCECLFPSEEDLAGRNRLSRFFRKYMCFLGAIVVALIISGFLISVFLKPKEKSLQ